ncbi:MAG: hypothetical protein JWM53_2842, partial [bacterium]|nr:hypothetical protein [bacterium]
MKPILPLLLLLPVAALAASEAPLSDADRARLEQGRKQVAAAWRADDGSDAERNKLVAEELAPAGAPLDGLFARFEEALEQLDGHFLEIQRALQRRVELDLGPVTSLDKRMAELDPAAHLQDDLFATKIAMVALLNFPLTTLQQRLDDGEKWSRRQWAEVRLAQRFERRVPAAVQARLQAAESAAGLYIAEYNILMHHLVDGATGARPFPRGMRLISHWNLRDELKANYAGKDGLQKQRMIAQVMQRIVDQSIPKIVINNATVDWDPFSNKVTASPPAEIEEGAPPAKLDAAREPDTRYRVLLDDFVAARAADP